MEEVGATETEGGVVANVLVGLVHEHQLAVGEWETTAEQLLIEAKNLTNVERETSCCVCVCVRARAYVCVCLVSVGAVHYPCLCTKGRVMPLVLPTHSHMLPHTPH